MSMIEDIRKDMGTGTPGPWVVEFRKSDGSSFISMGDVKSGPHMQGDMPFFDDESGDKENARRIARVPDMEAALLAAEELAKALDTLHDAEFSGQLRRALAAYRKATGGAA